MNELCKSRRRFVAPAVAVLLFLVTACADAAVRQRVVAPPASALPSIDRVFLIVLENEDLGKAMAQPFLGQLARSGAILTNYHALTHPSQPNYTALTAGQFAGITTDDQRTVDVPNLSDLFARAGVDWKVYAESYPGHCSLAAFAYEGSRTGAMYVRRHVPFLNYADVQSDPARCARIVNSSQLDLDLAAGKLPKFSMYIPNTVDDGHDTDVTVADAWMKLRIGPLLENPLMANGTLLIVTFDEGRASADNRIYTALWGSPVRSGAVSDSRYDHYDLLRTIEEALHLGTLHQNDDKAKVIEGVWR